MSTFLFADLSSIFLASFGFCFGLVIGSFLNVVIFRLPQQLYRRWNIESHDILGIENNTTEEPAVTIAWPASRCPKCGTPLRPWQNIPVLSYLFLKGRCASCSVSISAQYPFIELLTATVFALMMYFYGATAITFYGFVLACCLIALSGIDLRERLLPDEITLPLLWLGLFVNMNGTFAPLPDAVLGAIAGYLSLWGVYWLFKLITGKEGMGYGDFKLLAALGAWLGWQLLPLVIVLSSAVAAIIGLLAITIGGKDRNLEIPFGPFLATAGWIALIWGDKIITWYQPAFSL
jgi:leader peptidase (prepilin peptidase)/N-methyltransferase